MKAAALKKSIKYGNLKLVQGNKELDIQFLEKIVHAIMSTHYEERNNIIEWLIPHLKDDKLAIYIPKIVKSEIKREEKLIKKIRSLLFHPLD